MQIFSLQITPKLELPTLEVYFECALHPLSGVCISHFQLCTPRQSNQFSSVPWTIWQRIEAKCCEAGGEPNTHLTQGEWRKSNYVILFYVLTACFKSLSIVGRHRLVYCTDTYLLELGPIIKRVSSCPDSGWTSVLKHGGNKRAEQIEDEIPVPSYEFWFEYRFDSYAEYFRLTSNFECIS